MCDESECCSRGDSDVQDAHPHASSPRLPSAIAPVLTVLTRLGGASDRLEPWTICST